MPRRPSILGAGGWSLGKRGVLSSTYGVCSWLLCDVTFRTWDSSQSYLRAVRVGGHPMFTILHFGPRSTFVLGVCGVVKRVKRVSHFGVGVVCVHTVVKFVNRVEVCRSGFLSCFDVFTRPQQRCSAQGPLQVNDQDDGEVPRDAFTLPRVCGVSSVKVNDHFHLVVGLRINCKGVAVVVVGLGVALRLRLDGNVQPRYREGYLTVIHFDKRDGEGELPTDLFQCFVVVPWHNYTDVRTGFGLYGVVLVDAEIAGPSERVRSFNVHVMKVVFRVDTFHPFGNYFGLDQCSFPHVVERNRDVDGVGVLARRVQSRYPFRAIVFWWYGLFLIFADGGKGERAWRGGRAYCFVVSFRRHCVICGWETVLAITQVCVPCVFCKLIYFQG